MEQGEVVAVLCTCSARGETQAYINCVQKLIPTILTYAEELGKPPPEDDERNSKGHSKRLRIVLPVITFAIGLLEKGLSGEKDRKNRGWLYRGRLHTVGVCV